MFFTKLMFRASLFSMVVCLFLLPTACVSDSEEELNKSATCDTSMVTYNKNIKPIITNNCLGCHSTGFAEAGIELDSYEKVKQYGESGQLLGTISHANGFTPMPYELSKLSDCDIATVRNWINTGYVEQ
jgi:uncharacterized membrane protein